MRTIARIPNSINGSPVVRIAAYPRLSVFLTHDNHLHFAPRVDGGLLLPVENNVINLFRSSRHDR